MSLSLVLAAHAFVSAQAPAVSPATHPVEVGSVQTDADHEMQAGFRVDVDTGRAFVAVLALESWDSWYDWQWRNDVRAERRWDFAVQGLEYVDGRVEYVADNGERTVCAELTRKVRRGRAAAVPTGACKLMASTTAVADLNGPQQRVHVRLAVD